MGNPEVDKSSSMTRLVRTSYTYSMSTAHMMDTDASYFAYLNFVIILGKIKSILDMFLLKIII